MEAKKTKKADLRSRRALFFEAGLVVALAGVVSAFAWGQSERDIKVFTVPATAPVPVLPPITEQKVEPAIKPAPMMAISDYIEIVRSDAQITQKWKFPEPEGFVLQLPEPGGGDEPIDDIPVFNAEQMPSFLEGDINTFRAWVMERLEYPRLAIENNVQGRVTLRFVVERDGSLSSIEEIASPDRSLADEAIRVLRLSPKWSPGKQRGKPVRVFYILPVEFSLQGN